MLYSVRTSIIVKFKDAGIWTFWLMKEQQESKQQSNSQPPSCVTDQEKSKWISS